VIVEASTTPRLPARHPLLPPIERCDVLTSRVEDHRTGWHCGRIERPSPPTSRHITSVGRRDTSECGAGVASWVSVHDAVFVETCSRRAAPGPCEPDGHVDVGVRRGTIELRDGEAKPPVAVTASDPPTAGRDDDRMLFETNEGGPLTNFTGAQLGRTPVTTALNNTQLQATAIERIIRLGDSLSPQVRAMIDPGSEGVRGSSPLSSTLSQNPFDQAVPAGRRGFFVVGADLE
jgi:hypothetical protein